MDVLVTEIAIDDNDTDEVAMITSIVVLLIAVMLDDVITLDKVIMLDGVML